MTGSRVQIHRRIAIIFRSLVLVAHDHGDGRAQRDAELGSGLDLNSVCFVARGCESALAGAATGHLGLDICFCELHSWGDAVDDAAHGAAVRLAIAAGEFVSN
jgi:hypothetical protein